MEDSFKEFERARSSRSACIAAVLALDKGGRRRPEFWICEEAEDDALDVGEVVLVTGADGSGEIRRGRAGDSGLRRKESSLEICGVSRIS